MTFGATPAPMSRGTNDVAFRVWAPGARTVEIEVCRSGAAPLVAPLTPDDRELFSASVPAAPGDRYRIRRDDGPLWPDPASRFQPDGVHGASEIIDADAFAWTDAGWRGRPMRDFVIYELHVGTFSASGTFDGVREHLRDLVDLGVTAIELMPIAAFPGRWNWGYDGAALFAPSERYGRPDDLRRLVDAAHAAGISVLLDVVYNHLGPDGAYLAAFAPAVLRSDRDGPWGGALDLDPASGAMLREFFVANAVHWVREYHLDGLRLDATHAIVDGEPSSFVAEVRREVHAAAPGRSVVVIAEDDRNLATIVAPASSGGWNLDGVWADDFHHFVHGHLTGEREGYYADFDGDTASLASAIRDGWFYQGQMSPRLGRPRGTSPAGIPHERFVIATQNHDQVGNRPRGERLNHLVDAQAFVAATAACVLSPETPLLFMGQEWAATSPFQFFTDHAEPLGSQVVEGRQREFASFSSFADRRTIPSPQDPETFNRSKLRWDERQTDAHQRVLSATRLLLRVRREISTSLRHLAAAVAIDGGSLALVYGDGAGQLAHTFIVRLSGRGSTEIDLTASVRTKGRGDEGTGARPDDETWHVMWSTRPIVSGERDSSAVLVRGQRLSVMFAGPGAVMFSRRINEGCG